MTIKHKYAFLFLLCTHCIFANSNEDIFYLVKLQHIHSPLHVQDYFIEIYRTTKGAFITLNNYNSKTLTKKIDIEDYTKLVLKINKLGVTNIKVTHNKNTPHAIYIINTKQGKHTNSFSLESNVVQYGKNEKIRQIIREITNYANFTLLYLHD